MAQSPDAATLRAAELLKVLGDPTRLAVVRRLLGGPCVVGELNRRVAVDQSLLSHHLRTLREAGIVTAERDGKQRRYRIADSFRHSDALPVLNFGCCTLAFHTEDALR